MMKGIDLTNKCGSCKYYKQEDGFRRGDCLRKPCQQGSYLGHDPQYKQVNRGKARCAHYIPKDISAWQGVFQNARNDIKNCLDAMRCEERLSSDEADAGYRMFDDILSFCWESGIIDSYDGEMVKSIFHGLTGREGDDDE